LATTVFTTWSDLYDQMLDDLASGDFTQKEFRIGPRNFQFRDLEDMQNHLDFVKRKKDEEEKDNNGETGYGVFQFSNGGRG